MNESDRRRIEFCISTLRDIADLGRDKPLGDLYPAVVMCIDTLKTTLRHNDDADKITRRKIFVCEHCEGVYPDQPVSQCDCLEGSGADFVEGFAEYLMQKPLAK